MAVLEEAIVIAKEANVGIGRAKRVAKEMTAHLTAAEATRQLDLAMRGARPAAGSGALRATLARAEAAAATLGGGGGGGGGGGMAAEGVAALSLAALNEVLVPLMQVSV